MNDGLSLGDYYQCSKCGGVFTCSWTDEEAELEAEALFPGLPRDQRSIVCHDCWQQLMEVEDTLPERIEWIKRRKRPE